MSQGDKSTILRASAVIAVVVLVSTFALTAWYYLKLRFAFFDDVFIGLHIARNGADHGTWQYFTLMDRPALLASSPLKIVLLTFAAKLTTLIGFSERSFINAKLLLVVASPLAWAIWYPFWKDRIVTFLWLGAIYFSCALALNAALDFEGGLLFCWVATLVFLLSDPERRVKNLGWVIPLGVLIRPDVAIPVLAATAVLVGRKLLIPVARAVLKRGAALAIAWCALCWLMDVWPIPVTYWAKAAFPNLVDEKPMIEVFFERLGLVMANRLVSTTGTATLVGAAYILGFVLATARDARARLAAFAAAMTTGLLLLRAPSGFWWYYQNAIMVFVGVAIGLLARDYSSGRFSIRNVRPPAIFAATAMLTLMAGSAFLDGPMQWRLDAPSRAQGYQYLASRAIGDGRYDLPGIGAAFIKNPELGMTAYFSGDRAWIWDAGGLAQPLLEQKVQNSALRHFFPATLRAPALHDAETLAARAGKPLLVVEVWGMEDRNFAEARKKCRYVIEEGTICANDFLYEQKPSH